MARVPASESRLLDAVADGDGPGRRRGVDEHPGDDRVHLAAPRAQGPEAAGLADAERGVGERQGRGVPETRP